MKKIFEAVNKKTTAVFVLSAIFFSFGYLIVNGALTFSDQSVVSNGVLNLSAGGTNQNVILTPSGTGFTVLNGNVGVGTTTPSNSFVLVSPTTGAAVFSIATSGSIGLAGTVPNAAKHINIDITGADSSVFGASATEYGGYHSLAGAMIENGLMGVFGQVQKTSGGFGHGTLVGVQGKALLATSIETDNMISVDAETQVAGYAHQAYGAFDQVLVYGTGTIGTAYSVYADTVALQNSTITDAYGAIIKVRQTSPAVVTRAYGLALSGWSGAAGTSYGIYMDNSIDIGTTTKYAIYSSSASNSYFAGKIGIGTTTPATALHIAGATTPTLRIGGPSIAGCIELLDSAGNGTINYITATGGVLFATTTKPAVCQ